MKGEVLGDLALHMTGADNVVTAIEDIDAGAVIPYDGDEIAVSETVPFGHKVALVEIDPGNSVVKYGEVIGEATEAIDPGAWVHTHNCESRRGRGDVPATGDT